MLNESSISHAIVCDNLQKIYLGRDGNLEKLVVQGIYLAVPWRKCFGMLGPKGAGKTSFINMGPYTRFFVFSNNIQSFGNLHMSFYVGGSGQKMLSNELLLKHSPLLHPAQKLFNVVDRLKIYSLP